MLASIWTRSHLLLALALAALCAASAHASPRLNEVQTINDTNVTEARALRPTAFEATSAPTPSKSKSKKPKKTKALKTPKPTSVSATPTPTVTTKSPKATAKAPSTGKAAGAGATATGGLIAGEAKISKSGGKCVTGDPTSGYISKADVDWIWEKRMKPHFDFKNYIFDQLMTNKGKLSYCVRWDSRNKLSKATAAKFQGMLEKQYAQWNKWLEGYGCWPFAKIELEMVGVAVRDKSLLDWTDSSLGPIYAGVLDADGIPMCPEACYKHRNFEASSDTSACKGKPFDISLWPTLGQGGGAGGDWGQRVDEANMLSSLDADTSVIVAHEIGHGFGLPDFYEETDKPRQDMAKMIMEAGASQSVTEADGWLIRRAWEHVRMRYASTSG